MAITRSSTADRAVIRRAPGQQRQWRRNELVCTLGASLLVAAGLYLVHRAKSQGLAEIDRGLAAKQLLNLNNLGAREELLPALTMFPDPAEREFVARKIFYVAGGLSNVGAIGRIRVTAEEAGHARTLAHFRDRMGDHMGERRSVALLTGEQMRALKPLFVVRRPGQFENAFRLWACLFFAAFFLVHLWWSVRGFTGDQIFLPAIMLLSGIGLVLMVSLRDPVRDNLLFVDFAQGVTMGAVLLAAGSAIDFERLMGKLSFVPLLASFGLSVLLILFGSGPGSSDARVNLLGFQPVEIIRLLLVFFLAGYFASRWDILRHARETRPSLARLTGHFDIPPVDYTLPALVSVARRRCCRCSRRR